MTMDPAVVSVSLKWRVSEALLAKRLYEIGAIKFGSFELKNPLLSPSPVYIDLRTRDHPEPEKQGPLGRAELSMVAKELLQAVNESDIEYDLVAGIPHAGEPIAEHYFNILPAGTKNKVTLKKAGKGESRRICRVKKIPHELQRQGKNRVLLIDDVISGADTKFEAKNALEEAGYKIAAFVVVIDREQGGSEALRRLEYEVISWKKITDLLWFYFNTACIGLYQVKGVIDYIDKNKI